MAEVESYSWLVVLGAGGFGALLGWYLYFINRYRSGEIQSNDLVTLVGVLGGSAILVLFPAKTVLFGAYGIGLFLGFFGYFITLLIMVARSKNFTMDWFLDGRRKKPEDPFYIPKSQQSDMPKGPATGGRGMESESRQDV